MVNVMNCCNFLSNVMVWAPIITFFYLLQILAVKDTWFDPYTGEPLDEKEKIYFLVKHMIFFVTLVFLALGRNYIA